MWRALSKMWRVAVVVAVVGCGSAPPHTDPAPTADEQPADGGLSLVEAPEAKAALSQWQGEQRAAGTTWIVTAVDQVSNATDAIVVSRREQGGSCTETVARASVMHEEGTVDLVELGTDCCAGAACARDAGGWMIHVGRVAGDREALSRLIDPDAGVTVHLSAADGEGGVEESQRVMTRADVAREGLPIGPPDPLFMQLTCEERAERMTVCAAGAGGLFQQWTWARRGDEATLVSVSESSH